MIVNGRLVHDSEIWVNALTPERIVEIERNFQAKRREERGRIDSRFAPRTDRARFQRYTETFNPTNRKSANLAAFGKRCDRLIDAMERLAVIQTNQKRLLDFILD
jgi:hypothetical protein